MNPCTVAVATGPRSAGDGERERLVGDEEKGVGLPGGCGPREAVISLKCLWVTRQSCTPD